MDEVSTNTCIRNFLAFPRHWNNPSRVFSIIPDHSSSMTVFGWNLSNCFHSRQSFRRVCLEPSRNFDFSVKRAKRIKYRSQKDFQRLISFRCCISIVKCLAITLSLRLTCKLAIACSIYIMSCVHYVLKPVFNCFQFVQDWFTVSVKLLVLV